MVVTTPRMVGHKPCYSDGKGLVFTDEMHSRDIGTMGHAEVSFE